MTRFGDVLIVIPCLDEARHLPVLLAAMTRDAPGAQIVVTDGGSTDRSRGIVADAAACNPDISLLDNPARIQAAGINAAVRRHGAGRRWLVRIDAHCGYPPGYVATLVARAEQLDVQAVVVPMRARGEGCFQHAVAAAQNSWLGTGGARHRHLGHAGLVDHGHHALMAIDAFTAAGGYRAAQSHNEDAELDHRLTSAGNRIWLEPACAIDYYPRRDVLALFRQYRRHGAGRAQTLRRHRLIPKLRQLLPLATVAAVVLCLLSPLAWWLALPAIIWLGASLGIGAAIGLRRRSGCAALSGGAAMTMHFAWGLGFLGEWLRGRDREAPFATPVSGEG